ncbi:PIN-like domain-containing protein [Promicromonospora sp. NFX87]|uniref:PIN-like domain-containing protein n=1 Tax=Promicromonospora sp. NFX87 TaxID=3402691 RepID=UPI003AFABB27
MRRDDFIPPLPADEAAFLRGATVVLDTNVLLAPYKLSVTAREDVLRAIELSAERLWLPHQVGVEFYRNHASNRDLRSKAYEAAAKPTDQFEQLVTKHLGKGTMHEDLRKDVARVVRDAVSGIKKGIEQLQLADTAITTPSADDVLERIEAAFAGRAAAAPDPATIRLRTDDFVNWRVPSLIPPGFEDAGKPGEAQSAGDFLIWAEILEHAAANNLDILFVTEDGKDDWWETVDGQRRPHRSLVLEFQRATGPGRRYHQVGMETFVRLATEAAGAGAKQSTLNEIVAVNKETQDYESQAEHVLSELLQTKAWLERVQLSAEVNSSLEKISGSFHWRTPLMPTTDQDILDALDAARGRKLIAALDALDEPKSVAEDPVDTGDESDEDSDGPNDSP